MKKKLLPIGISDFKEIIEENYTYIDKTLLIQEILEQGSKVLLIPRPRRFGKTLNLSMLRYFFEKSEIDNSHLFTNFKIWKILEYQNLQGKFPVIYLTLKGIKANNWEAAYELIKIEISKEFRKNKFLLDTDYLDKKEKQVFQDIIDWKASEGVYKKSLLFLSEWLKKYYNQKVIILIDEYDTPVIEAYLNNYYKDITQFMRNWLAEGLKDNLYLERGILTGILRVAKESFFSDLNNITTFSILSNEFGNKFGFTEDEIINLLEYYEMSNELDEMREWYNGYRIGDNMVYNPWSILACLSKKGLFDHYWVNTSTNELLRRLMLKKGSDSVKDNVEKLLKGEAIVKQIEERMNFESLDNNHADSIWMLLLFTGYLTLASQSLTGVNRSLALKIPNREVVFSYTKMISDWFSEDLKVSIMGDFFSSLISGNIDKFTTLFKEFLSKILSYHDVGGKEPEIFYHAFVLGLLAFLIDTHDVKSNLESGNGRFDVMLIPKNKNQLGIVMEFKKAHNNESLEDTASHALHQIEEKKYSQLLNERGIKQILEIGLAFHGKQVFLKHRFC